MTRTVNDAALALIKQWEGLKLQAYRDVGGVLTIGYGHTGPDVAVGQRIAEAEAEALLRGDLATAEAAVNDQAQVPLSDNQFGALVAFTFNVGTGAFVKSTLLKRLNAGKYAEVPGQLALWNKVSGRVVLGLANRRAAESGLWVREAFVSSNTVATEAPASPAAQQARIAAFATAAATAAPALSAMGALPQWVGVAAVVAVGLVALAVILSKRGAAA